MHNYNCLKKSSKISHLFFCQYALPTLNKNFLISCKDIKRNNQISEHIYLVTLISNTNQKNQTSHIFNPIKNKFVFFSSYISQKQAKTKLINNIYNNLNTIINKNKILINNLSENKNKTNNKLYYNFNYLSKYAPKNDIYKNFPSIQSTYPLNCTDDSSILNDVYTFMIKNVTQNKLNNKTKNLYHCKHNIFYQKNILCTKKLNDTIFYTLIIRNNFGTKIKNLDKNGEENIILHNKKCNKHSRKENNEDSNDENKQYHEIKYKEEKGKNIQLYNYTNNNNNEKDNDPSRKYENIDAKELDTLLHNLEKIYENKNSKININIKVLVYLFKNFIFKNKELKAKIFLSFAFLICSKISIIYTPILLSSFIENVNLQTNLPNNYFNAPFSNDPCVIILSAYILSRVLSSTLNELRNSVFTTISQRISTFISKLFFYKIHNLNLNFILSKKNGELSMIFNRGCKSITNLLNVIVFQIIPIILEFILYLYILSYKIHYSVSAVTCINMLLYILFTTLVTKRRTIIRKNMNKSEQNTFNIFLDSIQNVEQVKYYTNELHELNKFIKEQKIYEKEAINVQKSLSFLNLGQQMILNFNLFLCLYLTYLNIANDVFPFSYLILVNTLLFQLAMPLNMFGTIYRETKLSLVDIECMIKILIRKMKSINHGHKYNIQKGNIIFNNVTFKYPQMNEHSDFTKNINHVDTNTKSIHNIKQNPGMIKSIWNYTVALFSKFKTKSEKTKPNNDLYTIENANKINPEIKNNLNNELKKNIANNVNTHFDTNNSETTNNYIFQNFSCHINDGEKVAIVGKSGLGKSTLTKLLLKFYEIESGNIYIDNKNIQNINLYTLRKNISIVPQDTILFNNTISYNIKYGNFQCTDKEMIEASIKSELHDKILTMENKYDTIVGERGTKLSIGEKQRICIARSFLKNSKILILDEHASNLDNENKKLIEKALHKLCYGKTTFFITHLMDNLQNMDKIIYFSGQNIYVGKHSELMNQNEAYKEFYNSKNNVI
ncbi:ABC transporter B family member 6, putative [Plasmodium berghei]|uniref:ABC transporter B family member 6, putative n=2 Tax=Plasmodium berghei TaxID=5821 RepID=A0A509ATT3_PLABA|nr:ABC transporter B family member 6, putative [Plasmodium berghei ANKA]CXJ05875.1 ABC transporter B family member 6, putative [Plasmodium berghei]SCL98871.1 ABC transporter B family member 6, putative [Plasmodium berghei]SCM16921.1 ABC transporter B family member 6, putative [Plasmodium berghei]SCM18719.1 ABC transporter B family member 6, putative [Plasmodium berghei]SCN28155.1 ABC transporter B family member 6, putative [Plasmodium berghei]|eukprot:XP_034423804.1 ABC transporter B family member 6, putative [Plasmodium berghei ANKA]